MEELNIYIPPNGDSIGGPNTFLKNFFAISSSLNVSFENKVHKNIFFPISYDLETLKGIKAKRGRIIQRLDGIYYPEKHGTEFEKLNSLIKKIYQEYATHVVFQSEYSRKQCFELFGVCKNYSIIHNGVNKRIFKLKERSSNEEKVIFITTGNFRNIDMLEPIFSALDLLYGSHNFELHVLGPITENRLSPFLTRKYCKYLGATTDQIEIAEALSKCDALIYSHLNPPCPNSVLEAISVGLPVLGFDSGAMSELCFFNKDLLAPASHKTFQVYSDFKPSLLAQKIELFILNKKMYSEIAMINASNFDMIDCVWNYIKTFHDSGIKKNSFIKKMMNRLEWSKK